MTASAVPAPSAHAPSVARATPGVRERWRMGVEARALVLVSAVMVVLGLAVLYSASAFFALREGHGSAYYVLRQVAGVGIGVVLFAIIAKLDAEKWRDWAWPVMGVCMLLLLVIILPGTEAISPRIHGSRRWLNLGITIQPNEVAKLAVVIWTAMLVVKKGEQLRRLTKGLLPFLIVLGVLNLLVILEPDLSQALMYSLVMGVILFVGGVRIGHVILLSALALPLLWNQVQRLQYVLLRMVSFLDPGSAQGEVNYQLKQSLIAVGSGQVIGVGFGEGRSQNPGYLPFAYNDFIAANIGEEWGFVGLLVVTLLFAGYGWLGFRIARQARTPFQQLVAVGLTVTTVITAYLHIGVVVGLLPTTGLTLPFFSYGRTNLLLTIVMTAILVNIGSTKERVYGSGATDPMSTA